MDFKNLNLRSFKKYLNPKATDDLNAFLENLPAKAGQTVLIAAGIAWGSGAAIGLYTTLKLQELSENKAELEEMAAGMPSVPTVRNVAENAANVEEFVQRAAGLYPNLEMRSSGSKITISAADTRQFGTFREAISHVQNGGQGWRVDIDNLCVGRQCSNDPLSATLNINKVSIENTN